MKINFLQKILDEDNKPAVMDGTEVTLRKVCTMALFASLKGDENLDGLKKGEIGFLGLQIQHSDELDLKSKDIELLKDRIGKICSNLVIYRAFELLDPSAKPTEAA